MAPNLTTKQEAFAQAVAGGMTQAGAYRAAYDSENMLDKTIIEEASRIMADRNVTARVKAIRDAIACEALWSRLDSIQALSEIAKGEEARANEKVAAIKELNLMHGFNAPTKLEVGGTLVHKVELVAMRGNGKD